MIKLLVNLPEGFFETPQLKSAFDRLAGIATIERTSCNTPEEIAPHMVDKDAIIMWAWPNFTPEMVTAAPNLGYVGYINLASEGARACLERCIAVSEARHGWSLSVAELALTLILAGLRRTSHYHAAMRAGTESWTSNDRFPSKVDPLERRLTGRKVGIVGFGGIGKHLARILAPFDCDIVTYDPFLPEAVAIEKGVKLVGIDELIDHAEIIALCAATTDSSKHLFGKAELDRIQPGTVFVNVSRSALIDTPAFIERLKKNDITALIDVFDEEPLPIASPLRQLPNVYATPHRAGGILESIQQILGMLTDDLEAHLAGRTRKYPLRLEQIGNI